MRLVLLVLALVATAPALADDLPGLPAKAVIESAITTYIRPSFHAFAEKTAALEQAMGALCAGPAPAVLTAAQDQFRATVLAFSRIEFVQMGPLGVDDRLARLLFWPDPKGIALRQVQQVLANRDLDATDPQKLYGKSVALQGLGALEFVLFGTGAADLGSAAGAYRCDYGHAITQLIDSLGKTMDAEWTDPAGASDAMLNPKPTASDYRTETEVVEKFAATLLHGTEAIRDQRITPVLGAAEGSPKPKSALFWRSGLTVPSLVADFTGLADFFAATRFPEAMGPANDWIAKGTQFEFANAIRGLAQLTDPIDVAVTKPGELKALNYIVIVTGALDTLVGDNLAVALGLTVGFSALDGD